MLKGILFDLDGTLVDSLSLTFDGFNHALEAIGSRRRTPQEIMAHFGPGEGPIFAKLASPERADEAFGIYRAYVEENLARTPLHRGVPELLDRLKAERVPISIVTGRGWETTEIILNHHGLKDRFVTVIAHEQAPASKPSPAGIQLALDRMGLDPSHAAYVGDTWADVQASRRAGVTAVAALWDLLADRAQIEPHQPHHWADAPHAIWDLYSRKP